MRYSVKPGELTGTVSIPGSKSHTIRALLLAMLADGVSEIYDPLRSADTLSCLQLLKDFGVSVETLSNGWRVHGCGGKINPVNSTIDVGNSGTTLYLGLAVAALSSYELIFTGDMQIQQRPAGALVKALSDLSAKTEFIKGGDYPPVKICGPLKGGETAIEAVTSQYLSALLLAAPLIDGKTIINVPLLNEKPYVEMTLAWLDKLGIKYINNDFKQFIVEGPQTYKCFKESIPADFSSAAFFLAAGALSKKKVILKGLDMNDTQGDKEVVNILREMGAEIKIDDRQIEISGGKLHAGEFDLNAIPDALPILSVVASLAEGRTHFFNVAQARLKETDRIAVMKKELTKMGVELTELPDGLSIKGGALHGAKLAGHYDHRIVMSLAVAASYATTPSVITTAESAGITVPEFYDLMKNLQMDISLEEDI